MSDSTGGQSTFWGAPPWAWGAGIAIGMVIGILLFDGLIVSMMFGVSIGTAFALAFAGASRARDDDREPREG